MTSPEKKINNDDNKKPFQWGDEKKPLEENKSEVEDKGESYKTVKDLIKKQPEVIILERKDN